ncbi:MAG: PilZ domain-containing protein [Pseudomonadota bacterium]
MRYRPNRRPASLKVSLRTPGGVSNVRVLDVSEEGLKVVTEEELAPGTEVVLSNPRIRLDGTVRWCKGGRAGIQLSQKIDQATQAELSGVGWSL